MKILILDKTYRNPATFYLATILTFVVYLTSKKVKK